MRKNKEKNSAAAAAAHKGLLIVLNILSAAAAVHLVFAASFMIGEFRDAKKTSFSAQSMRYYVSDGRYGSLVSRYYEEGIAWRGASEDAAEYAALSEYIDAVFRYKTYTVSGDSGLAERAEGRMKEAKSRLSLLLMDTKTVDRAAGLDGE